jgi:hypothetical protein
MKYWDWPPNGIGSEGDVDFSDPYDWTDMLDSYTGGASPE